LRVEIPLLICSNITRTLPSNSATASMPLPLSGLLVVSLEQAVAAPMCTCRLADAGARVIKVERPEGDFARYYDKLAVPREDAGGRGESAYFVWLNRGKESVVLDLARADDKALLAAMLAKADVFVQNLKPGAIAKLGFPLTELRRAHPRLVICSISGYGEDGPYEAALTKRLAAADIAFARVNATADLAVHPQLRRIEIATPSGVVSYPAPPARIDAAPSRYGAVPALGEHTAKIWAEFLPGAPRPRE
jgi:itaconate CoA-transferase